MDHQLYLKKFEKAAKRVDKKLLTEKKLYVSTGIILGSAFLKIYKKEWTGDPEYPMNATSRIFFSLWVNEKTLSEKKIFYNIHALKLRQLRGYSISSRKFAEQFREYFKQLEHDWENVSTAFGPLTLMEGWEKIDDEHFEAVVIKLSRSFLRIDHLIDKTMKLFAV